jgi:ubiquinone/menaquinone biosynthesis C-methylase UbiE
MEGWHGWDDYAPFYDWENARTVGRRDIRFWQRLAEQCGGPVLELGCGTGRVAVPVARTVDRVVGIDRSDAMLRQAQRRLRRGGRGTLLRLVRGDVRSLPFLGASRFRLVMAPYGMLQSLLRDRDLRDTLRSVFGVLRRGGTFAMDLVPDLPRWSEYARRVSLRGRGRGGAVRISLIESVRQDWSRRLTIFDQEFVERRGHMRTAHRFSLVFRTLSVRQMRGRLRRAGFTIETVLGDYTGGEWHREAETWIVLARKG